MTFRSPENVQRNELVRFQLESNIRAPAKCCRATKKMVINLLSTIEVLFFDWFNAFFEVRFKLDLKANGGDNGNGRTTIINGSHSLIKHMVIKEFR